MGGKGSSRWSDAKDQLGALSDPAKAFQQLATACGLGLVFGKGKGKGKSQHKGGANKGKGGAGMLSTITENNKPAFMETAKGDIVPMLWVCHGVECRYPHHAWRLTCTNCKLERQPEQEPRSFDRSKVKPRLELNPADQLGKSH